MKKFLLIFILTALFAVTANAENIRIASGAGYKKLVEQWAKIYEADGGKAERIYGNMGQVTAQVRHGGGICIVVGDKRYLSAQNLPISQFFKIGEGKPALVTRKGLKAEKLEDLKKDEFKKIAAPDFKRAIYGRAAKEILSHFKYDSILRKTIEAGTVPRSGAYSISGQTDASFINLTYAIANKEKFGSVLLLKDGYKKIEIVAGIIKNCMNSNDVKQFLNLLETKKLQKIITKNGL